MHPQPLDVSPGNDKQTPVLLVDLFHRRPGRDDAIRAGHWKVPVVLVGGVTGGALAQVPRLVDQHVVDHLDVAANDRLDDVEDGGVLEVRFQDVVVVEELNLRDLLLAPRLFVGEVDVSHHGHHQGGL